MKRRFLISLLFSSLIQFALFAQEVNYRALNPTTHHLVSAQVGAGYGTYYGISYGYVLNSKIRPVVVGAEFTVPFGEDTFDDWKAGVSVQAELLKLNHFSVAIKPAFILHRYDSPMVRMYNIGAGLSLTAGYVKKRWGVVAIGHYDRAFASHLKNEYLRENYPQIQDGWYNSSGGNFKFGARAHISFSTWSTFLTIGKPYGQDFSDNPTIPFFTEFSIQKQF